MRMVYLTALLTGGIILGSLLSGQMPQFEGQPRRRFSPQPLLANVVLVLLGVGAVYFTVNAFNSFTFEREPGEIQRAPGLGVLSQFVLIGCGGLAIINLSCAGSWFRPQYSRLTSP